MRICLIGLRSLCGSACAWSLLGLAVIIFSSTLLINDPALEPYYLSEEKFESKSLAWGFGGPIENELEANIQGQAGVLMDSSGLAPLSEDPSNTITTSLENGFFESLPIPPDKKSKIKIAQVKKEQSSISKNNENLPDAKNYFTLPAKGWNWGELHYDNAVDIADKCGSPVYSAAEGLVIEESGIGNWNQGYGNYILIEHPNNTRTKYAHTSKNLVKIGDYIPQGEEIAKIGATGKTHGPSGCHLHFEVSGAKNPFAIK